MEKRCTNARSGILQVRAGGCRIYADLHNSLALKEDAVCVSCMSVVVDRYTMALFFEDKEVSEIVVTDVSEYDMNELDKLTKVTSERKK